MIKAQRAREPSGLKSPEPPSAQRRRRLATVTGIARPVSVEATKAARPSLLWPSRHARQGCEHLWLERREPHLKVESGEAVARYHFDRCGRDMRENSAEHNAKGDDQ